MTWRDYSSPISARISRSSVISRSVLEHQDDDVVELLQIGHARVFSHRFREAAAGARVRRGGVVHPDAGG
jgi:hypothetical protein